MRVALANIGEPALPALLDRIMIEDAAPVTARCVAVIVRIVGKERVAELLKSRIEGTTDSAVQDQFKRGWPKCRFERIRKAGNGHAPLE